MENRRQHCVYDWRKRGTNSNDVVVRLGWDSKKLYLFFKVSDSQLNAKEKENRAALWRDDAVEVYIGTSPDSVVNKKLTKSDYQFIVNINNAFHTIRGGNPEHMYGKDFTWTKDIYTATTVMGTKNNNSDADSGYTVEMAIDWSTLNYIPSVNDTLLIDLCNDDLDSSGKVWSDLSHLTNFFAQPDRWWKLVLTNKKSEIISSRLLSERNDRVTTGEKNHLT